MSFFSLENTYLSSDYSNNERETNYPGGRGTNYPGGRGTNHHNGRGWLVLKIYFSYEHQCNKKVSDCTVCNIDDVLLPEDMGMKKVPTLVMYVWNYENTETIYDYRKTNDTADGCIQQIVGCMSPAPCNEFAYLYVS